MLKAIKEKIIKHPFLHPFKTLKINAILKTANTMPREVNFGDTKSMLKEKNTYPFFKRIKDIISLFFN